MNKWVGVVLVMFLIGFNLMCISNSENLEQNEMKSVANIKEVGGMDAVMKMRIDAVYSFVYNDSYGLYHCIFVDGSLDVGL